MARVTKADKDLLAEFRKRLSVCLEHDFVRDMALDDIKFIYDTENNSQWDDSTLAKRKGRANYTFNRVIGSVNQVIGDQRQNQPQIKVRGVDSQADPETAETYNGLIRNIENISDAETAYDTGFKTAVAGGFGAWKVVPDYSGDDTFDQDIYIKRIPNPFTVYFDPAAKDFQKRDANYVIVTERINKDEFEAQYPKASTEDVDFDDKDGRYITSTEIRIAEYWRKKPVTKQLCLLSDGRTVDKDEIVPIIDELEGAGIMVVRERTVKTFEIEWAKVSGAEILEGPTTYQWKYLPVVPCYGRVVNIEGVEQYEGIARHAKDAQRSYNYTRSTALETIALQPRAPYMVTPAQIKGHENMWAQANAKNYPYMLYEPDPDAPGPPARQTPPNVPVAMITQAQQDSEDIQATTGYFTPSLGAPSNEVSGVAVRQRQGEGDVGSFEFIDNLGKAIRHTGEILVDMIPKVYDTERQVRILGVDGSEEFVAVNQTIEDEETGEMVRVNDLATGKYDVAVSLGPSFTTQRQEALTGLLEAVNAIPMVGEVAADQIVKNLDVPGADEIEKRVKTALIQTGAIQPGEDDDELMAGLEEAMAMQNQAVNADLEQQRIESEAQLKREAIEAQGDVEKEAIKARNDQEKRDWERDKLNAEMANQAAQRDLERDKMALERDKMAAETASQATQSTEQGQQLSLFAQALTQATEAMARAAESMAQSAQVAAMPKELVTDEDGNPIGARPVQSLNGS